MNSLDKQIRDRIEAFAEELAQLVKGAAVESVQEALGQALTSPTRKKAIRRGRPAGTRKAASGKKAKGRKTGGRIRRSPEQLESMSSEILAHIKANPGQRLEQIAVDLGMRTAEMKRPVALLLGDKKLSTRGQRRGTTYYAGRAKSTGRKKVGRKATARKKSGKKKVGRRTAKRKTSRKTAAAS